MVGLSSFKHKLEHLVRWPQNWHEHTTICAVKKKQRRIAWYPWIQQFGHHINGWLYCGCTSFGNVCSIVCLWSLKTKHNKGGALVEVENVCLGTLNRLFYGCTQSTYNFPKAALMLASGAVLLRLCAVVFMISTNYTQTHNKNHISAPSSSWLSSAASMLSHPKRYI